MFFVAIGFILLAECCLRFLVKRFFSFRGERLCSLLESSMLSYEMNQVNICGAAALKSRVSYEAVRRASEKLARSRFARTVFQGKIVRVRDSPVAPVVTIEDGEDLEHVMEREINRPFDETSCPFRSLVLCGAERDCLIVVGRHVNFDGLSALELLRRLLILVQEPDAVFPDSDISNCDEFVLLKGYMPLLVQLILVVVEAARELLFFRLRSRSSRPAGAVSAVSLGKGCVPNARSNHHCQFVSKTLSESETAQIIDAARSRAVTVGNAVLAAAMQARCENDDVWASLQADFRRMTAPSSSSQGFLFGNLTPVISLSRTFAFLKGMDVWDLAKG